jgi:hypothetical protein
MYLRRASDRPCPHPPKETLGIRLQPTSNVVVASLHASERAAIENAFARAARGGSLSDAAERTQLRYGIDTVRRARHDDNYARLVATLEPLTLFGNIVETDADYRVVRLRVVSRARRSDRNPNRRCEYARSLDRYVPPPLVIDRVRSSF